MCGWQVKLCDPLVTHGPYLSTLEVQHDEALYKSTFTLLYFTFPMIFTSSETRMILLSDSRSFSRLDKTPEYNGQTDTAMANTVVALQAMRSADPL